MDDGREVRAEMVRPSFSLGIMEDLPGVLSEHELANTIFDADTLALLSNLDVDNNSEVLPVNEQPVVGEVNPPQVGAFPAFLAEDLDFQRVLAEGGDNRSTSVDKWAINRLTAYKEFRGLDMSYSFEDLPSRHCVALLCKFFEQTCKQDGKLYPSATLMGLYRAFD